MQHYCLTRAIMSRAVNRKEKHCTGQFLEKCTGRDALPPSTGILDRADLQLRSLQDISHGALRLRSPPPTVRSATKGSRDPLPWKGFPPSPTVGPHMGDVPTAAPDLIVWN